MVTIEYTIFTWVSCDFLKLKFYPNIKGSCLNS